MLSTLIRTLTCVALAAGLAAGVSAQQYPTKPIRFVVPFAPGGGTDLLGRTPAQKLNAAWGQAGGVGLGAEAEVDPGVDRLWLQAVGAGLSKRANGRGAVLDVRVGEVVDEAR